MINHRTRLVKLLIILMLAASGLVAPLAAGAAAGQDPLPPMPSEAIRNAVIQASGGVSMTSLGMPAALSVAFSRFSMAPFNSVTLDAAHIVHYIDFKRADRQILIPRIDSATLELRANTTSPDDNKPAMVIGGYYDWTYGPRMVLAIFPNTKPDTKPSQVRLYTVDATGTLSYDTPYKGSYLMFKGVNGQLSSGDVGALIAAKQACYALGLDQLCLEAKNQLREMNLVSLVQAALQDTAKVYDFDTKQFDNKQSVPDIVGVNSRLACRVAMQATLNMNDALPPSCNPNIVFTASKTVKPGDPVALFNVIGPNDMKAYDLQGNLVGSLPIGSYLVVDATPSNVSRTPGNVSVFFLINADKVNHFLIPNVFIEGFGDGILGKSEQVAAIKDGTTSGWGF